MTATPCRQPARRALAGLLLLLGSLLAITGALPGRAGADTSSIPVGVTAAPTSALVDGQSITVNVTTTPGDPASLIYGVDARLCIDGPNYQLDAQFDPTALGYCIATPFGVGSDDYVSNPVAPPYSSAQLTFRAGVGSQDVTYGAGSVRTIQCGPGHPCRLVLRLAVPAINGNSGTNFKSFLLSYGGGPNPPGAPTSPVATAGNASASVTWVAPVDDGGATITGYTVTSTPEGKTCSWTAGPLTCTVSGLTNGTSYSFKVKATNSAGPGPESVASNTVKPSPPGAGFHAVTPFRALDSRTGTGFTGPVGAGAPGVRNLTVAGTNGIPVDATGVVMNVTVTGGTAASYLTVFPSGGAAPTAANLLFAPGQTVPNLVTVGLGAGGQVAFFNQLGSVHVIADVLGYYDNGSGPGDRFNAVTPQRLLDSRGATGGWAATPLGADQSRNVTVHGAAGVPDTATAVVMNVTVTGATSASYLSAYPAGATKPATANVLFAAGQTVPNLVTVGIGTGGAVTLYNQLGSVHVIADVVGYYDPSTGSRFHAMAPVRLLDSRGGTGGWAGAALGANQSRTLTVGGTNGIPGDATGVVMNVTVTGGSAASYLSASPKPGPVPAPTANLLFAAGQTVPNAVLVGLGTGGGVDVYNQLGSVHVIADAAGYFSAT